MSLKGSSSSSKEGLGPLLNLIIDFARFPLNLSPHGGFDPPPEDDTSYEADQATTAGSMGVLFCLNFISQI